jgi:hypothetical protein
MSNDTDFDMDSLLEGKLDDLADVPEFKNFPNGAHTAIISFKKDKVNKHPCIKVSLKGIETQELADPTKDKPIEAGTESGVLYMLDNPIGQGKFKELMKTFAEAFGIDKSPNQLMEEGANATVLVVTTQRPSKDKTKMYMDIVNLSVV